MTFRIVLSKLEAKAGGSLLPRFSGKTPTSFGGELSQDLGVEDLGVEDLGVEDLGVEDLALSLSLPLENHLAKDMTFSGVG